MDLRGAQYDEAHNRIDLNPPGRRQNKKHRPVLAVTPTLKPWLQIAREPTKRYVAYGGKPIKSITSAWSLLVTEAGLDERVTPYSIRHGMAREMRKRKVPKEQISIFLGHLPKDSDATTSIYAPYDPEYCSEAVAAIEAVMNEVRNISNGQILISQWRMLQHSQGLYGAKLSAAWVMPNAKRFGF
jgi:integrase